MIIGIAGAAIIVAIAVLMPCAACRRRRERLEAAYEAWRRAKR